MGASETYRAEAQDAVRDVRRRAAVAAAAELFADRGFHSTSMAEIARGAGLSLKAMYATFDSKEALFTAVLEDVAERFSIVFEDDAERDPTDRLLAFVDRVLAAIDSNPTALRLYRRGADGVPAVLRDRGVDPFAGFTDRLHRHLAETVRSAQEQGAAPGLDPDLVARALPALVIAEAGRRLDAAEPTTAATPELRALFAAA
jgi:AcrR family transcriptional regulator